ADVDGDGKQEIVYGAATIDHDGSLLYSSFDILPPGSADPGALARLGHGDAMHVTDIDPNRPGLELCRVQGSGASPPYGYPLRGAGTGAVTFGGFIPRDAGRGMVADILPDRPGLRVWASPGGGLWTPDGEFLSAAIPGTDQIIKWAA